MFVTTNLSDSYTDSSALLRASSNIGSFMSSLIWGGRQIYQLSVSPFLSGRTSEWKTNVLPCQSTDFRNTLMLLTWYVRVEAEFCFVQQESETERYASQVLTLVLTATFVWHNVAYLSGCPRDAENKNSLYTHLGDLGPVQPP